MKAPAGCDLRRFCGGTLEFVAVHWQAGEQQLSQAYLKFCCAKEACEHLNHLLTQPDSKCLAAV